MVKKSTRDGFGKAISQLGEENKKVVVVSADLASSTRVADFAQKYPKRFFECGVAENNMLGVAAGLALEGKIPFACSFASFSPYINWATLRQSVCLNKANVKLVSTHAGIITGADGATHQALEDLALVQALPEMIVVVPADYDQAYKTTLAATKWKGPVYLRLTRPETELISSYQFPVTSFQIGKAQVLKEGKDLTLIACGPIIFEAIKAIKTINDTLKVSIELINYHTIKPLDKETILKSVKKTGCCLTLEDHQVFGGLGSAVAQLLAQSYPIPMKIIGIKDQFGESARKEEELIKKFKLDAKSIAEEIKMLIKKKKALSF